MAGGKNNAAGGAVNVNVITNPTNAFLDSNVQANVADATQITAESSLTPSQDPIPNSPSDTIIAAGTLTKGSNIVTEIDGAVIGVLGSAYPVEWGACHGHRHSDRDADRDSQHHFTGVVTFGSDVIQTNDNVLALITGETRSAARASCPGRRS